MAGLSIYFCGSIRGGRQDRELYAHLIEKLKAYGTVLTEHIGNPDDELAWGSNHSDKEIYEKDMDWLHQADVVVAEVTQPSLGVGVEIGRAIAWEKRILCLFRPSSGKHLSALISGADDGKNFFVKKYEEKDVDAILKEFLEGKKQPGSGDTAELVCLD